jgi:O-antigen ligase
MAALLQRLRSREGNEILTAAGLAWAALLVALVASRKLGTTGLLVPLGLVAMVVVVSRAKLAVAVIVGLTVLCEGPTFGLLSFSSHLYDQVYKGLSPLDLLVVLAVASVGIDVLRHRRPVRLPPPLVLPSMMLALAMVAGAITGHAAGASVRSVVLSENVLGYLLLLPLAVANLDLDRRQLATLLKAAVALAALKAVLGLLEIAGGYGLTVQGSTAAAEGGSTLTYYEPTANWLIMIAVVGIFAALVGRARPPRWVLLGSPLLLACLLLSYRRSFWIATVLALLLALLLGTSTAGRRLLLPAGLIVAAAIWLLGAVSFDSQSPVIQRVQSLAPSSLTASAEDRYRLDERANVLGAVGQHPLTGLGMTIPWVATVQPLSVEHVDGRQYVHFAALWYWLKLGVLGLLAYLSVLLGGMLLAWRTWRRNRQPWLRVFGLASLCGFAGLGVIETTASFTGVDARFTVLLSAQLGVLAVAARRPTGEGATGLADRG